MSEFFWSDVDSDAAREQHEVQVERARVAVAGAWPFLSEATSRNDYLNRLSLVEDRIHNAVASATSTDAEFASVLGALHETLDRDWYTLREARVREARAKRARAKRAQRKHAGGWAVYDAMANDRRLTPPVGTREEAEQARIEYLDQNPEADPSWVYVGTTFFGEGTRKRAQGDEIEPDEPTGQGAADVDDVPTPGQEVADYPQPEGEGEPGSTPDGEGEWANEDGEAREARKTAVSLSNVGIDPETGNGVGTDPSGQRVQFHLSDDDRQQLKDVLHSDLAVNFSGVDVAESDIIRESRKTAMDAEEAWGIVGNQRMDDLRQMVKALKMMRAMNTPEEERRLEAAEYILKNKVKNPRFSRRAGGARGRGSAGLSNRQARKQAAGYYGGGEVPEDLIRALNNRQYGGEATVTEGPQQSRVDVDGGSYVLDGVTLRGPYGESGTIYSDGDGWTMEFFDGSFLRIWREGNGYVVDSYGQKSSLDRYMATRKVAWSIDDVRRVVRNWQYETVDGMMLDATSAYLLMQVYDAIDEGHKQRLSNQPLDVAVDMAAKVLNRAAKKAGRKVPSVVARRLTKNAISVNLVSGNGEVIVRAPGESTSSLKRMLRGHNISARVIDNGDDTFEISVSKSEVQDAAKILRSATRKQAASTLDEAIETAKQNLPIQKKVVAPHAQTGYTILQKGDGRYSVHEDSAWGDRSGGFLPSSGPPEGTPVAKVDLDGNVQRLSSRRTAATYLLKEFLPDGSAAQDNPVREFDDIEDATAEMQGLEDEDRANGTYRLDRWRIVKVESKTAAGDMRDPHDRHFVEDTDGLIFGGPNGPMIVGWDEGQRMIQEAVGEPRPAAHLLPEAWFSATYMGNADLMEGVPRGWRAVPKNASRKVEVEQIGPRQFLWAVSDDERLYGSGIAPTRSLARREAAQHLGQDEDPPDAWCLDCDIPVWEHGGHWLDDSDNHHDRHQIGPPKRTADNSRSNNPYTPVGESNPFAEQGNPYDLTGEDVTDQGPLAEDMAGPVSIEGPPQTTRPRGGGEQDGAPADPNSPEGPQPVGEAAAGRNRR